MTKRIFRSVCLAAFGVLLASLALIMGVLYNYFSDVQQKQLRVQTELAAQGVSQQGMAYFEKLDLQGCRLTWIDTDGTVLYDSQADAAVMEKHDRREEVAEAFRNGYGESARFSDTLTQKWMYSAKRLPDGTVLRLSNAQNSVLTLLIGLFQPLCVVVLVAVVLSLLLASRLSKSIVEPLNQLNLDDPLSNEGYDELSPLLRRIDSQQRQIRRQRQELHQKRKEFQTITGSMSEGLVLLNEGCKILSINDAAARLLETDQGCLGQDIVTVNRSLELQHLLQRALQGQRAEKLMELGGGEYRLEANPVFSDGVVSGLVLLMLDVTEKEYAERMRREFTANVSHELKTPLHTISGCAELLSNGLVKPEDEKQFAGQIYTEAQRMIRLVEDIIRLSRLDEGAEDMKWETVDLHALAAEVVGSLMPAAQTAQVELNLTGQTAMVSVIPQLANVIISNLCDNAIKYNHPGGRVDVDVTSRDNGVLLTVADTGIGIPVEHQNRVFERFYRVDKSRSKAVGGTGLGLSIVKHAARVHNARIDLHSQPGTGTTISVLFPLQ